MSKYTVELRRVIDTFGRETVESWFTQWDLSDYLTADEIKTINERGTFDKQKLASMIVDTYYMREIGTETVGLFQVYTRNFMRQIMGEYALLVYSSAIKFDPLVNEDYTDTFNRDATSNVEGQSSSNGTGFGVASDTPQTNIDKQALLNGSYATTTSADEQTTSGTNSGNQSDHESYTRTVRGNRGISSNAPYLIQQYREYIRNLYGEIVEKCGELFMGIY